MLTGLAASISALLPQTQCTRCGYPDCDAYALAVSEGTVGINQCPPGGAQGIALLAVLTGQAALALNPRRGTEGARSVAFIDEGWCIGCTLCIDACPTDAIVGSHKLMHTVIERYCTGCELCLPVCPVDCILLENVTGSHTGWSAWSKEQANEARTRYKLSRDRRTIDKGDSPNRLDTKATKKITDLPHDCVHSGVLDRKRAIIEAALARARIKRATDEGAG